MNVTELMSQGVRTCSPSDTLERAAQIMWEQDCGALPIIDKDGRTVGMITDRDVCMAAYMQDRRLSEILVSVAASRDLVSVHPEDHVDLARILMETARIRRLPVVDGEGRAVGLVGLSDLARVVASLPNPEGVSPDPIARTLAAVTQPRAPAHDSEHTRRPKHGPIFRVRFVDGGWDVFDRNERHVSERSYAQVDAVVHAKELARRSGSAQIVVYDAAGKVTSNFFYQREERPALASDDSTATMAASHVVHHTHN